MPINKTGKNRLSSHIPVYTFTTSKKKFKSFLAAEKQLNIRNKK
jgi:hypothetical protein